MARRSRNWNEDLARDLKDAEFARRSKIASSNIIRAIDPRHNPTQATLNRLLRPFDLMLTIAPINSHRTKGAA